MQQAASSPAIRCSVRSSGAKQYPAQLATTLRVRDALAGHLLYVAARLAISAAVFLVIMGLFGTFTRGGRCSACRRRC